MCGKNKDFFSTLVYRGHTTHFPLSLAAGTHVLILAHSHYAALLAVTPVSPSLRAGEHCLLSLNQMPPCWCFLPDFSRENQFAGVIFML